MRCMRHPSSYNVVTLHVVHPAARTDPLRRLGSVGIQSRPASTMSCRPLGSTLLARLPRR